MAQLNTDHLSQCIKTLEYSLAHLNAAKSDSVEYEVFRNATIKGFELTLETSGKLLRKALKNFTATARTIDALTFKELLKNAAKHDILTTDVTERWFKYRDNRNNTAHDYGIVFTKTTLELLPQFLKDAKTLEKILREKFN